MTIPTNSKFTPPTLEQWLQYADELQWSREDAEAAYDHYVSVGWKIGTKNMKEWRSAARNCKRRSQRFQSGSARRHQPTATLGALQMQLKAVDEELNDLLYPGGCAFQRTLTLEQARKADQLRQQRRALKERISCV